MSLGAIQQSWFFDSRKERITFAVSESCEEWEIKILEAIIFFLPIKYYFTFPKIAVKTNTANPIIPTVSKFR